MSTLLISNKKNMTALAISMGYQSTNSQFVYFTAVFCNRNVVVSCCRKFADDYFLSILSCAVPMIQSSLCKQRAHSMSLRTKAKWQLFRFRTHQHALKRFRKKRKREGARKLKRSFLSWYTMPKSYLYSVNMTTFHVWKMLRISHSTSHRTKTYRKLFNFIICVLAFLAAFAHTLQA